MLGLTTKKKLKIQIENNRLINKQKMDLYTQNKKLQYENIKLKEKIGEQQLQIDTLNEQLATTFKTNNLKTKVKKGGTKQNARRKQ